MFRGTFILWVCLSITSTTAHAEESAIRKPGPHPPSQKLKNPIEYGDATVRAGQRIYSRYCITCHGKNGKGQTDAVSELVNKPTDFTVAKFKYGNTDGEIYTLIQTGTENGMMPYKNNIKENQLWHVVNYIRSFNPEARNNITIEEPAAPENPIEYAIPSIGRGKQFYARFCVKCHGMNGKGDTEMREFLKTHPSDLTSGKWAYGGLDGDIFNVIKDGTENDMPPFSEQLKDERIWHIVNYLRSLNPKTD